MSIHQVNDRGYYIEDVGTGEPIVLLHGFTGSSANWHITNVIESLSSTYRVLAIDLIGHGRSDSPTHVGPYSMPSLAADLGMLLEQRNALPAHWLGYSMGGRLALYIAVNYPQWVRSLILESASPGLQGTTEKAARRQQDEALANQIEVEGIESFAARWEKLPLFASQEQLPAKTRSALRTIRLSNSTQGLANSLRGMGTGAQPSLWEQLSGINISTLLIAGELDQKFVAINQRMAAVLPNTTLHIIAGSGHTVHLERADQYIELTLGFLRKRLADSGDNLAQAEQSNKGQRGQ
ncbi:MAG: 2-succinyl-6-hydroxy-2,4-cyclohexadiene-1-carboxylate synthase [Candidatus Promineofilum sp.]|nr:2-succinyl-6-hydroxy-2,4-cyclohexadiene-1-carboxylate synthase [Promineifilum sp.]